MSHGGRVRVSAGLAISILLAGSAISAADAEICPSKQPKNEAILLQIEQSWAKALEHHDSATVACILADEFEDIDVDGNVHDRPDTLTRIPQRRPSRNELQEMQAHVYGDFAFVRGQNTVTAPDGKLLAQV